MKTLYVHRLVLEAFVGPCPEGHEVCHGNGDPSDNRLENLRWGTPKENSADSAAHGTRIAGSRVGSAKLIEGDVPLIVLLKKRGFTSDAIGELFGVTGNTISCLVAGKTWQHVTREG